MPPTSMLSSVENHHSKQGDSSRESLTIVLDAPLEADHLKKIQSLSSRCKIIQGLSRDALLQANVVYTSAPQFALDEVPRLQWVQLNTAAVDQLQGCPLSGSEVPVANVHGAYSSDVAELTLAMLLTLTRKLHICHDLQRRSTWPADDALPQADSCNGKTMGIIGYGSIGRHVARLAHSMGMNVLACKRHPEQRHDAGYCRPDTGDPLGTIPSRWFGITELAELLKSSDVVVCTLPSTPHTRGLIGHRELSAIPRGGYFINVGRGKVVDENALSQHLFDGHLAGAALDVFSTEPLHADSPLWQTPNLVITPHIASWTHRQTRLAGEVLLENLGRYLAGQPLINRVDLNAGY